MRADWTASGACTNGSTVPPRGATRRASGGDTTTCTTSAEPSRGRRWGNRGDVILLVTGVMDLRAMAVVAAAITVERLAPVGERVARAIGAVAVGVVSDRASCRARMTHPAWCA